MNSSIHLDIDPESGFGIDNLPFGVFSDASSTKRVGVAIGAYILDLAYLEQQRDFGLGGGAVFCQPALNAFASKGRSSLARVRASIQDLLTATKSPLGNRSFRDRALILADESTLHLPFSTQGFTDFYSSEAHATNVGCLFRGPENALNKNWKQLPVAYNGRASTLVCSGFPIRRPWGQMVEPGGSVPSFGPTKKLDFEVEMGFFVGTESMHGEPISTENAEEHIFGFVLVNDWSARDIQAWEYQPLGPFLGKSFATSISPWVVTQEALAPYKISMPPEDTELVSYLRMPERSTFDIDIALDLQPKEDSTHGPAFRVLDTNFSYQYWSIQQQLAHHSVNGCKMCTGDLLASGTLSGKEPTSWGCLLELTRDGREPLRLSDRYQRAFLEDGDKVTISAVAQRGKNRVSFGTVVGEVCEALGQHKSE